MASVQTNWEDDENNRCVELDVKYQLENGRVEIVTVTPTSVRFLDPAIGNSTKSVGVWTDAGRNMLTKQLIASSRYSEIRSEIAATSTVEIGKTEPASAVAETTVATLTA